MHTVEYQKRGAVVAVGLLCLILAPCSRGFSPQICIAQETSRVVRRLSSDDETDLFDYFDPLLSPHAYPDGVSPDHKPKEFRAKRQDIHDTASSPRDNGKELDPDLFEYFDPLLSPHAYPDGISPDHKPKEGKIKEEGKYNPLHISSTQNQIPTATKGHPAVDPSEVFDPTLSPHLYPNGTPSAVVGDVEFSARVGILLMDHGSRNKASNDRLHELAQVYQEFVGDKFVVRAAHMEIASPSITEGLEKLMVDGVDEVVCHPFFLSPHGRHVAEDIPQIIQEAVESLNIEVPVVTTPCFGSDMDVMVNLIHSIVKRSASRAK